MTRHILSYRMTKLVKAVKIENSTSVLWEVIRKHVYSDKAIQALCELIDNAITSILERRKTISTFIGKILISVNFDANVASIEDNGTGFPNDDAKLAVAWSYGFANPHGLSEHGCGTKSALSIFDPSNQHWIVQWKNGDGKIYEIRAPLSPELKIYETDTWMGKLQDPTGVYIQFPFSKECVKSLYSRGATQMRDAETRCKSMLTHIYMNQSAFQRRDIHIYYNDEEVRPFVLCHDSIEKMTTKQFELSTGGRVAVTCLKLKEEIKSSPWFRNTQDAVGVYLSKCGRHITHATGEMFSSLTGRTVHPSFAGKFILVALEGEQHQLPPTDPTKSTFDKTHPLFEELCSKIQADCKNFLGKVEEGDVSERELIVKFRDMRENQFESAGIPDYSFVIGKALNSRTTPLDAVETFANKVFLYEAKKKNTVSYENITQLFANYLVASRASEKPIEKAILLVDAVKGSNPISQDNIGYAKTFNETRAFPFQIWNYNGEILWSLI